MCVLQRPTSRTTGTSAPASGISPPMTPPTSTTSPMRNSTRLVHFTLGEGNRCKGAGHVFREPSGLQPRQLPRRPEHPLYHRARGGAPPPGARRRRRRRPRRLRHQPRGRLGPPASLYFSQRGMEQGSNVSCSWSDCSGQIFRSAEKRPEIDDELSRSFASPGFHKVTANCSNQLSFAL